MNAWWKGLSGYRLGKVSNDGEERRRRGNRSVAAEGKVVQRDVYRRAISIC